MVMSTVVLHFSQRVCIHASVGPFSMWISGATKLGFYSTIRFALIKKAICKSLVQAYAWVGLSNWFRLSVISLLSPDVKIFLKGKLKAVKISKQEVTIDKSTYVYLIATKAVLVSANPTPYHSTSASSAILTQSRTRIRQRMSICGLLCSY